MGKLVNPSYSVRASIEYIWCKIFLEYWLAWNLEFIGEYVAWIHYKMTFLLIWLIIFKSWTSWQIAWAVYCFAQEFRQEFCSCQRKTLIIIVVLRSLKLFCFGISFLKILEERRVCKKNIWQSDTFCALSSYGVSDFLNLVYELPFIQLLIFNLLLL